MTMTLHGKDSSRVGHKNGPFLKVCNSSTLWCRKPYQTVQYFIWSKTGVL